MIHKKPTPIRVVSMKKGRLIGFFEKASTTDFNGIWNGKYIDFDAKQTAIKTSFPLDNVGEHQYEHLKQVDKQGGIAFLLVRFSKLDQVYILPFEILYDYWENAKKGGRKSIPLDTFVKKCYNVDGYDYLRTLKGELYE